MTDNEIKKRIKHLARDECANYYRGKCLETDGACHVINPGYETREAELRLPGAYWPQYADGKTLKVSLPARQVMIVDPANGKARPAATLPPAPVKKPMDKGLLQWMAQSGILPRVQNDKR